MKEEDIRKRDVLNRYLQLVTEDASHFYGDRGKFEKVQCPACEGRDLSQRFEKIGFAYVQCNACDTLFVSPRPTHQDLMKIYRDSPSTKFWVEEFFLPMVEVRREKIFKPRAELIAERFPEVKTGRLADIGAGFGLFLEEMKKIWPVSDVVAIEPSNAMAEICRSKNIVTIESALEDVSPKERFDLMTAFELLEHLHDPFTFVRKVKNLLAPGGYLCLTTLNGLGFDIQLFWERSKSVFPPHHLNFLNPHSMKILMERNDFEIVETATPGQLDWDIVEGAFRHERLDPGRFFRTLSRYGTDEAKRELQQWIRSNNFSSHMRVIAKKK